MQDLAKVLVDDEGEIHPCPLEYFDAQNKFLLWWEKNRKALKEFRLPLCHQGAEKLVRDTLFLISKKPIHEAHVRRAVVVAALSKLRQNIGSCFATAPAILIHDEQPENFIRDLLELLSTGRLKRTFGGVEYAVPLCLKYGNSDCALLKAWEFTLAAFSEVKMEFSRWNLYLSLGLHPEEKGGIGEVLYQALDAKLAWANRKTEEHQMDLQRAVDQLRTSEALLRQASTESEMRRFKAECQTRYYHMQSCEELRDKFHNRAKQLSLFFSFLIRQYDTKFQEYFQEIYDPEMVEYHAQADEDRPAGFRLAYKHGRRDPTLWTLIEGPEVYIRSLVDFFTMTESQIAADSEVGEEKQTISEMTTAIIQHVRSEEFLKSSMARSAKYGRTPWAYISGGTMETLLKTYYCREEITHESRWVEDPLDLSIFILETLKALPSPTTLLMQSPTHAFILQPEWEPFCQGWKDTGFTYTWLRDHFINPMQEFYATPLSQEEQQAIKERNPQAMESFLFQSLPLIPASQCQTALQQLLEPWISSPKLPDQYPSYLMAHELREIAKTYLKPELHLALAERARQLKLAPQILRFADTNWVNSDFAFVINPLTSSMELWRVDLAGTTGVPMTSWNQFFGDKKSTWVIYINPLEYQRVIH
jgi:hypothetical protein